MELRKVLVACGWPYVNHLPHLGTLVQVLSADVATRYYRLKGADVLMVSGSDEHGTPIEVEALRLGILPKQLTDRIHSKIVELFKQWGFSFNNYTRTENPTHKEFVQNHLTKIYDNGYIFVQEAEMLYCEKCSRFLPDRYVEGKCPYCSCEHARGDQCDACGKLLEPTSLIEPYCVICKSKPVTKRTKHWYFDLTKFSEELRDYVSNSKHLSNNARNFSLNFIKKGLKPRSVSRDVDWGIPAPFPEAGGKTIYVWIEAVLGYISATIEYFKNCGEPEKWRDYWFNKNAKTLFFIGKDNIPFHTIIFPALLLASHENYNMPWNVSATEFLQFKGEAFSKSRRIGIWIDEASELFPADYWRYFLMATRPETKDTNFSWEVFIEKINADLNNTYGNFIHRTLKFINTQFNSEVPELSNLGECDKRVLKTLEEKVQTIAREIEHCRLQSATSSVISTSRMGNHYLDEKEPWNTIINDRDKAANTVNVAVQIVKALAIVSEPFIPFAAEELWRILNLPGSVHEQKWNEASRPLPAGHKIGEAKPLFRKIEASSDELGEMLEKIREKLAKVN